VFGKKAVTVIEEIPRDFLAELHEADAALGKANAAIDSFRRNHFAMLNGVLVVPINDVTARAAMEKEAGQLCRARDVSLAKFQTALKTWAAFRTPGGNKDAGQQSVS